MPVPLRDRLQAWEVTPPPGTWEKLSAALSEDNANLGEKRAEIALRDRLRQYETPPPAAAWQAIAAGLEQDDSQQQGAHPKRDKPVDEVYPQAKVVPHRSLAPYLYRYAGIAAIVALVVWGLNSNFFNLQKQDLNTSIVRVPAAKPNATISAAPDPRHLQHGLPRTVNLLAANYINTLPPASALRQLPATTPDARYYRISNELGQPVRLSAKFAPLYYQLLSDLETESGAAGTSFKQMQQALLHGSFMPDPANLFDVVSLKDVLENDQ
ncbi:MAG TPA: hypothetical protein PLQ32_11650 [Flavihumibacter sp.]|nr:DotH/IcmK family type IV secretion protein [Bacteroidota bacterium]HOA38551.1 hypothetical protein [Flavihumibacter sp.]HPZ88753.1 hypothetical protein [Flavihumibacter sp.]HQD09430.1 hypothetical protein [Flavihumibacter sp.]